MEQLILPFVSLPPKKRPEDRDRAAYWDAAEARWEAWSRARFMCVDCGKDTCGGEYYMVSSELWAASGLGPTGGMLCLADLERRIGRPLAYSDFTAIVPRDWHRNT